MLIQGISKICVAALLLGLIISCGGDGGHSAKTTFVDSPVMGIAYKTAGGKTGVTNGKGQFEIKGKDSVIFSVGAIALPSGIPQGKYITPAHLAGTAEWEDDNSALNIIRFLMSIDEDGDAKNGIQIPSIAFDLATEPLDFSLEPDDFSVDMNRLLDDLSNELGRDFSMVSVATARKHFAKTLKALDLNIEIQSNEPGEACSALNTADAQGVYSTTLTTVLGEPSYLDEATIEVLGIQVSINDALIEAETCRYVHTENNAGNTDTWTWSSAANEADEIDTYAFIKTSGILGNRRFTVSEANGAAVSSGVLTEVVPE